VQIISTTFHFPLFLLLSNFHLSNLLTLQLFTFLCLRRPTFVLTQKWGKSQGEQKKISGLWHSGKVENFVA